MIKQSILFLIAVLIIVFSFLVPLLIFVVEIVTPRSFLSNDNIELLKSYFAVAWRWTVPLVGLCLAYSFSSKK